MLLTLGITVVAFTSIGLAALIYPSAPSQSRSVRFDGFIVLPRRTPLSVLDSVTFNSRDLFVTDTSTGSLFKVKIDADQQGTGKAVMELTGASGVHGVVVVPPFSMPSAPILSTWQREAKVATLIDPDKTRDR
jgi:hypothetical protein